MNQSARYPLLLMFGTAALAGVLLALWPSYSHPVRTPAPGPAVSHSAPTAPAPTPPATAP